MEPKLDSAYLSQQVAIGKIQSWDLGIRIGQDGPDCYHVRLLVALLVRSSNRPREDGSGLGGERDVNSYSGSLVRI